MQKNSHRQLTIRPASQKDIEAIRKIAFETWPLAYEKILGKEQLSYMLDRMYSVVSLMEQMNGHHSFFIAIQDIKPIGFASYSVIDKTIFKLQKLYVLPGKQKTGVGQKLLQSVENEAKKQGGNRLQLNVNRNNISRQFYERNGFSIIGSDDIDIGAGFFMNDFIMQKEI